ncbi:unnamed protein product [Schistosoma curassoni]|uniref:Gamma-soluble NSF attachment protein n=1 Tax=Schistosoma curassoni TaxID=6186 RepID=A0A183KYQ0_9TREM|nr:unnamed protein product [Schistosoma curassoni]
MSSNPNDVTDLIAKAEKCLKISLLKRRPDYDGAIEYYGKAALLHRNRKQLKEAAETYKKVAELHFKNGSYFHCAKQYEIAAQMYRDLKDFSQMASLIAEAGLMLRQNGTPDSASYVYERAAKSLEEPLPERAAEFYERSADACELCGRAVTVLILIKLYMEDEVAAKKIFNEAVERWRFPEAEEFSAVRRLLAAVDDMDKKACEMAIKDQCFRMLDLDVSFVRLSNCFS